MHGTEIQNPARRRALLTGGGLAAFVALPRMAGAAENPAAPSQVMASNGKPLPLFADWVDSRAMIVHSANTIELRRQDFGQGPLTATNHLYVRNHMPPPPEDIVKDPEAWEVEFAGVTKPQRLKVADLKRMGLGSVTMVLQCSGNGRGYFPHKPAGDPWTVGAAGCVTFSGVPVRDVVQALGGVAGGMRYMTSTGGEILPAGIDHNQLVIERSVPWDVMEHALLAWQINGEPLPLAHGGPLRMIVPGYFGINNIKYVKRVAFTQDQSPAKVQQTVYRFSPIGTPGAPNQPTMWKMPVNSWVTSPYQPGQPLRAGRVQLAGVAFGGFNAVQAVEVSLDGGQNWRIARWFGPDLGRYAWRNFVLEAELKPGKYHVASRATDDQGQIQPQKRAENNSGFANNSWADHSFELEVA